MVLVSIWTEADVLRGNAEALNCHKLLQSFWKGTSLSNDMQRQRGKWASHQAGLGAQCLLRSGFGVHV